MEHVITAGNRQQTTWHPVLGQLRHGAMGVCTALHGGITAAGRNISWCCPYPPSCRPHETVSWLHKLLLGGKNALKSISKRTEVLLWNPRSFISVCLSISWFSCGHRYYKTSWLMFVKLDMNIIPLEPIPTHLNTFPFPFSNNIVQVL